MTALTGNEIHLVQASLCNGREENLLELLDDEERARAARLLSPEKARQFIATHGILRRLIALYTGVEPQRVRFSRTAEGKPVLAGHPARLHFSLSHSSDLGVFSLSRSAVGIDLELVDPHAPVMSMAEQFFSRREVELLKSLPAHLRRDAFYRCWTRKEAYVKACGKGFLLPPDRFTVSLAPEAPPALLEHELQPDETSRWQISDVAVPPGFHCAVATQLNAPEIKILPAPELKRGGRFVS